LQQSRQPDFHELIQIAGRDRQKLDALQQGIVDVERFLQDTAVELQPGKMPVNVVARIVQRDARHQGLPQRALTAGDRIRLLQAGTKRPDTNPESIIATGSEFHPDLPSSSANTGDAAELLRFLLKCRLYVLALWHATIHGPVNGKVKRGLKAGA
jgi:hypothetical protein